jgi:hypothetical protein
MRYIRLVRASLAAFAVLACTGCAVHKPAYPTYRLAGSGAGLVLIPPGVATAGATQKILTTASGPGRGACPPGVIKRRGKHTRVTVTREMLAAKPSGWLSEWAAGLEADGCIAPGTGQALAHRVAEALPLDPALPFRLLYSNQLDIIPNMRIQVDSPILRDPAKGWMVDASSAAQAEGNGLTLAVKSSDNLLGYETAWYVVRPKNGGAGVTIAPLYAERHMDGATARVPAPAVDYWRFPGEAAFFRVFYEAQQTQFTAFIIAARTRAELDRRSRLLAHGTASCENLRGELCVAVPRKSAVNGFVPVTVNGAETMVLWGGTVAEAIRAAGGSRAGAVPPGLTVYKLHGGKPVAVEFDHSTTAILGLIVTGGEIISWE